MSAFVRAQAGDAESLADLVRTNLPLVRALCGRFDRSEDAFQMGCMGLVRAIRGFREDRGCAFSTYAVPVILGEMRRARQQTLGWRARGLLRKAEDYRQEVLRNTGREPAVSEAAARVGVTPEELMLLEERAQPPMYDETGELLSSLPDPDGSRALTRFFIRDILERMPPRESALLRWRFMDLRTQTEIARALGVAQYTVSRLEKKARLRFIAAWNEE